MSYHHLSEEERYHIYELKVQGLPIAQIASRLNRHKTTIYRELKRNSGLKNYRPRQAQELSMRRKAMNSRRIDRQVWLAAKRRLREDWSPSQIAIRLQRDGIGRISHESIYQRIYQAAAKGEILTQHLRCQRLRRRRYGAQYKKRGQIPGRIGIEQRPEKVNQKKELGHWEGDTVHGAHHRKPLVTLTERRSQLLIVEQVDRKQAQLVCEAIIARFSSIKKWAKTLTLDNGMEFADHQEITKKIGTRVYFADPYSSWQRGLNEQINGLLRQYFPKKMDFRRITQAQINRAVNRLNNRPRKSLDYQTPWEVFCKLTKQPKVALRI